MLLYSPACSPRFSLRTGPACASGGCLSPGNRHTAGASLAGNVHPIRVWPGARRALLDSNTHRAHKHQDKREQAASWKYPTAVLRNPPTGQNACQEETQAGVRAAIRGRSLGESRTSPELAGTIKPQSPGVTALPVHTESQADKRTGQRARGVPGCLAHTMRQPQTVPPIQRSAGCHRPEPAPATSFPMERRSCCSPEARRPAGTRREKPERSAQNGTW